MKDIFSQQSDYYARYRPTYPKELYDFIFSYLKNKESAWDCATGSGQVANYLADHFKEIYANDISTQQLSFAPQKENIKYFNVASEKTGFPAAHFDLITVAMAIHWFNFDKFYKEVKRTAKEGALFAAIGYGLLKTNTFIDEMIKNFDDKTFGKHYYQFRSYIDEEYETIPFPFKEIKSPPFSHTLRWSIYDLEGFFNSWSSVQKIKNEEGYNPVDSLMQEIRKEWKEDEIKEVTFPVFVRLGVVDKSQD